MELAWPAIFAASLVGSMHCAGMCGPLMAVVMAKPRSDGSGAVASGRGSSSVSLLVYYHGARGLAYALLGAAAGAAGQLADLAGVLAGLQPLAATLAAVTLLLTGALIGLRHLGARIPSFALPKPIIAWVQGLQRRAFQFPPATRAMAIGACTALLPCGWLYAFATVAAGTASPLLGAFVMVAFWAGSVPILSALGLGVWGAGSLLGPRLRPAFSVVLIAVGAWALFGRAQLDAGFLVERASAASEMEALPDANGPMPCCSDAASADTEQ
ncbi:MAG: sulfite exporter TauE/SafE [Planctomycetota bacterium]|jgi:sulfite exporter TauE/SafE